MADRIHPYPMFPQSLTPNSLQQSQIPQQPQQSQQPDPQMISALSNTEHSRMWQQQINQLQNAYRPQQSGDLAASQMNHQMQEFVRGQALSHPQGQPMVQQIQQSFGLNAQRMNPVFHDPQAGQSQPLIQPNFPSVPMNTQQQIKAPFNMNPMMHGLNNPGVSRQLMLNQQEMARLQQQSSIQAQRAPNPQPSVDMFAPSSVQHSQDQLHGSPHLSAQAVGPPGPNQGMGPGNPQQKRMMTSHEIQDRKTFLLRAIQQTEGELTSVLQNARTAGTMDTPIRQRINGLRTELLERRELYTKFMTAFGTMLAQQLANGIPSSNMSHMNPMAHSNSQHPPQSTVTNGQAQPNFVTQPNQSVSGPYNIPTNVPSPLTTQGQGTLNQQIPIQPPHTPIGVPNVIPTRTTGTPHEIPGGQLPNVMSPNLAAQGGQKGPIQTRQSVAPMPLDKERFDSTYAHFCRSQNINSNDHRIQIGENRFVDLHQLHVVVMREGGARSVTMRDMWPVIGGRLGITQFPGNDSEPARCGPGIAQQLQNTYEQYLQHFENAYILTVKNRAAAVSSQHPINANSLAMDNNATAGMSGNSEMPSNPRPLNQQVIAAAARYAHMSAQDMRAQRIQEQMITFVERHRPELQKVYQQQAQFFAKRQEQNLTNVQNQLANMHDPPTVSPQVQRAIGANPTVNMAADDSKMVNGSFLQENVVNVPHRQVPTQEQIQQAATAISYFKQVFQQRSLPEMPLLQIPEDQRLEHNQLLEQLFKMTSELDPKLPLYFITFRTEDFLRKYVTIVLMVTRQRQLLRTLPPQYIIHLNTLRTMYGQIHKLNEEFENRWRAIRASSTSARLNPTSSLTVPPLQNTSQITPVPQTIGRQVSINPPPPPHPQPSPSQNQIQPPPPPHSQSQPNQSQLHPQQQPTPPMKKPFRTSIPPSPSIPPASATVASPTPPPAVASSSTPAASAPTPQTTAASPQTPKSPPSKAVTKTKATARVNRKQSTVAKGPATPETAPPVAGVKRPSDDEVATLTSVTPSEAEASNAPSPKKAKTEWDGEMSDALIKKQQEVQNIKTEEDAAAYFMKELIALTASADEGTHHDIASSLGQILAGMPQEPVDAAALSLHGVGDAGPPPTALSPHLGSERIDPFFEFVAFSSFTTLEDEDESKAPTPDLVPSSETNLSPESGSEGDSLGGSPDKNKNEESGSDPLRLGSLKEIDGGESAYYQIGDWKWEGTMPTLDQPWAIFPS